MDAIDGFMFGVGAGLPLGTTSNHQQTGSTSSGGRTDTEVQYLEDRLDRLSLICMAMWSLMQDKSALTEADLIERVKLLDLMDGKEDGKATRTVSKCAKCDRPMNRRHQKCIYCGHDKLIQSAFDAL